MKDLELWYVPGGRWIAEPKGARRLALRAFVWAPRVALFPLCTVADVFVGVARSGPSQCGAWSMILGISMV